MLRRFWYATRPVADLAAGPQPFTLLGENLVLWQRSDGQPAALRDRCCHRTAKLSKGFVDGDHIVCGYHGWTYDAAGACVRIPQCPGDAIPAGACVPAFHCQQKYGLVWVALDTPLKPVFDIPEDGAPGYRRIHQFNETWRTGALRLMENSFDAAHFAFVHRGTFGQFGKNKPEFFRLTPNDDGFEAETRLVINNPADSHRITGTTEPTTVRHFRNQWHLPFNRRLGLRLPERAGAPDLHLRHAHRRRAHPAAAVGLPQRHRSRLPGRGDQRLGPPRGAGGPGHPGDGGRRCAGGRGAPCRTQHAGRPAGPDHAPPAAGAAARAW